MKSTKIFVEVGDIANTLVSFIGCDDYNRIFNSTNGSTKEDGFKSAFMVIPLIIMANCQKYVVKSEPPKEG